MQVMTTKTTHLHQFNGHETFMLEVKGIGKSIPHQHYNYLIGSPLSSFPASDDNYQLLWLEVIYYKLHTVHVFCNSTSIINFVKEAKTKHLWVKETTRTPAADRRFEGQEAVLFESFK